MKSSQNQGVDIRKLLLLLLILVVFLGVVSFISENSPHFFEWLKLPKTVEKQSQTVKIVTEESVVIDVVKKVGPSVVTISEEISQQNRSPFNFGPFFFEELPQEENSEPFEQNIGSGFIVSVDGLIVSNKHVVANTGVKYQVVTHNGTKYEVEKIYRDPLNDIAILKINPSSHENQKLTPVKLGDSSKLQVGQLVIAIGTPLGEFSNSVTTGVVSGLGRGIVAGSQLQGFAEELDNVIQTDAAINPGNSGGPLLNSAGQVIGINTAIAQSGQNIGFALPINVVKESIENFNETGQFNRPYLGVAYQMISLDSALKNNVPQGAYVLRVVEGSSADRAGIRKGDIITKIDGQEIEGDSAELASIISNKKVGDSITITLWRKDTSQDEEGKILEVTARLDSASDQ